MENIHGGDIYNNKVNMDFSVNINPLGIPNSVKQSMNESINKCDCYPDIHCSELKSQVSKMLAENNCKVKQDNILFGNGASELFMAIVHAIKPKNAVIPVPSFYGYDYALNAVDCNKNYCYIDLDKGLNTTQLINELSDDTDIIFIANPNNPTGQLLDLKEVTKILDYCFLKKIYVVIDECFIDFCETAESAIKLIIQYNNLIVVRAFTKIYAIPGVRLGYLVCGNNNLVKKIQKNLPEWNVSVIAQSAGIACIKEEKYLCETKKYVSAQRKMLTEGLVNFGFKVFDSGAVFILFYSKKELYKPLLKKGILIRDCSNYKGLSEGFYRIAVKSEAENIKLLKAIGECIEDY